MTNPKSKPSYAVDRMDAVDRAEAYLLRIVALTGARRMGFYCYALDVGKSRFEVYDSYVCRISRLADPGAKTQGTCFHLPNQHMPAAEKIATALLQLRNNPTLFDKWASQSGAFKADAELFN